MKFEEFGLGDKILRAVKDLGYEDATEIQVGYYHIIAQDADEAVAIAKRNPEFEFSTTAQIEVRMIKGSEAQTGFVYPR